MPTIAEACQRLGITQKIFTKWLNRVNMFREKEGKPPIKPEQHPYDMRFHTLTDDEVQEIADARSQMPRTGRTPLFTPRYVPPVAPPQPAERPPVSRVVHQPIEHSELPVGLVTVAGFLMAHGMDENQRTTWTKAMREGRLTVVSYQGEGLGWKHGSTYARHALDAAGRRQAWERWHTREWWVECDDCVLDGHAVQ